MARKGKLKRWFVSMLSGVVVATTVMGTSVVSFAVDDNQPQLEDNQGDNNASANENQNADSNSDVQPTQETTEPEVKVTEVIVESGNGLVITTNPDSSQTANYDKEVSGMITPESTQAVIDEKTAEQESIKSNIEGQGGSYSYDISQDNAIVLVKKEVSAESKEDAEQKAEELGGEIKTTEVKPEEPMEITVGSEEEAQAEVDRMNASGDYKDATLVSTEDVTITAKQTDFKGKTVVYSYDEEGNEIKTEKENEYAFDGYHVESVEGKKNAYKIVITGGVDEIKIDLLSIAGTVYKEVWPGDEFYTSYTIVNESGDDYEISKYEKNVEGMARWAKKEAYDLNPDRYGRKLFEYYDEGRKATLVAFVPNDIREHGGSSMISGVIADLAIAHMTADLNKDGEITYDERHSWANDHANLSEEELLEFYHKVTGNEDTDIFNAWKDFFLQYAYTTQYWTGADRTNENSGQDGKDFFNNETIDLSAEGGETQFMMGQYFDINLMDNLYMQTRFSTFNEITIKALPKIRALIDYTAIRYSVEYDDEVEGYVVTISGSGSVPAPTPDPGPDPTPTPDPTPVITTPGDAPAVLGAQRELPGEAPAVLGARRAGTSDETNMVLRLIVIAASASVLVIARKRAHN